MADKKKAAPKKKAPAKKSPSYCLHLVKPAYGVDIKFERAGTFDTKEKAEEYIAAHPGWPYLEVRES
tara:strand:- start:8579 stop:8779 length:201 start_codon:yes stop_codon:yes gene_type:complete